VTDLPPAGANGDDADSGGAAAGRRGAGAPPAGADRGGSSDDVAAPPVTGPDETGWERLAGRMLAVHGVRLIGALVPIAFVLGVKGGDLNANVIVALVVVFGGAGARAAVDAVRWATTRYRVTPELVEVRSGLLQRSALSIPRDRVRTVNVTAKPLHRLFGLSTVAVGTGRSGQRALTLDAVPATEGAQLRAALLARGEAAGTRLPSAGRVQGGAAPAGPSSAAVPPTGAAPAGAGPLAEETSLARIRWRWLPYHLLSPWTLALPVVVVGGAVQALDSIGVEGAVRDAAVDGLHRADDLPLALAALVLFAVALVVGIVAASAVFVESWWAYRLTREPGGTLHVRRGLLTSRSLTIEQRRLRGVELTQPLPLRLADGASLQAIVSGLKGSDDVKGARVDALLPAASSQEVAQVAAAVLREPNAPAELADVVAHPRAALRRRLTRAATASVLSVAVAVATGPWWLDVLPGWVGVVALMLAAAAPPAGRDAYRSLGHLIVGRHLVTRHGTFVRRTVALERDGVIGWTASRSPFQRRAGLMTLTATTAAGSGGYRIVDVDAGEGTSFAAQAVPGVLEPFLRASPERDAAPRGADAAAHPGTRRRSSTTSPATDV
jgi:putative membrane protein